MYIHTKVHKYTYIYSSHIYIYVCTYMATNKLAIEIYDQVFGFALVLKTFSKLILGNEFY